MKKLKLSAVAFEKRDVLTRSQLKKLMGGGPPGSEPGSGPGGYYKCCNDQACTSCGASSWVPAGATASCPGGNGYVCHA